MADQTEVETAAPAEVQPTNDGQELSAMAKIRQRMNATGAADNNTSGAEEVVPGLCINCKQAELDNGVCPSCGFSQNEVVYNGGL